MYTQEQTMNKRDDIAFSTRSACIVLLDYGIELERAIEMLKTIVPVRVIEKQNFYLGADLRKASLEELA
jgi:hypothetical protein